jgi:tRNA (guanine-N7-)-methyltransferase
MRMRHKPWALSYLEAHPQVVFDPTNRPLSWNGQSERLILEIGSGKGRYVSTLALRSPLNHYVALEKDINVSATALKAVGEALPRNLTWIVGSAADLERYFNAGELDEIHLNFSDPWPKKGHEKRRLTSKTFMPMMLRVLKAEGILRFKTDNAKLFEYTVLELQHYPLELLEFSVNYTHDGTVDVHTEYEQKFNALGQPIYRAVWRKRHD